MRARAVLLLGLALGVLPSCSIAGLFSAPIDVACDVDADCAGLPTGDTCARFVCVESAHVCRSAARDQDHDGYGDAICSALPGAVDCGDLDPLRHPGATERCDGVDDDCDGAMDEGCVGPTAIASGDGFSCAIREQHVFCWGACADSGVCGVDVRADTVVPQYVDGIEGASRIVAGRAHACALADGSVWCWGAGEQGQLGAGSSPMRARPALVPLTPAPVELAAGADRTCARLTDGSLWCWGTNDRAYPTIDAYVSSPIQIGTGVGSVAIDANLLCRSSGPRVRCLVDGSEETLDLPATPDALATGLFHVCARLGAEVWCAGDGSQGQLGDGMAHTLSVFATPAVQASFTSVAELDAGGHATCVVDASGGLRCVGALDGLAMPLLASSTLDGAPPSTTALAMGSDHVCVIGDDQRVYCMGDNVHHVVSAASDWTIGALTWVRGL